MQYKNIFIFLIALAMTTVACEDSYTDGGDASDTDYVSNDNPRPPTALDNWLASNFTLPYNIEVKYHWDASELDLYKTMVPPAPARVQPVMEVVKKVWIDTYSALASPEFIKQYCPKQFVLVGSARYNFDGTITLGTAEGGRKVVLYVVNDFVQTDAYAVKEMMHTIEHEFAHILHQTKAYPAEFKQVTPGDYTANWNTFSVGAARQRGFITNYAMLSPDEDFAEMVAMLLVEGQAGYEEILRCYTTAASEALIRKKEQFVVQYFQDKYSIDFYALQTKVQEAIHEVAPGNGGGGEAPTPVVDLWGFGKDYTAVRFDLTLLNEPAEFAARYAYDNSKLHDAGYALDYSFKLFYTSETEVTLRLYYYTDGEDGRVYSEANFYTEPVWQDDDTVVFEFRGTDDNGTLLNETLGASAIASFFVNRPITIDWVRTCDGTTSNLVGFFPVEDPDAYGFGQLGN